MRALVSRLPGMALPGGASRRRTRPNRRCCGSTSSTGKLPPIEKRLPQQPLVVQRGESRASTAARCTAWSAAAATRGSSWCTATHGSSATTASSTWFPTCSRASRCRRGAIFTLKLRKGHRWSDGHPFTAEDFRYYWEDVANNKELAPGRPAEGPAGRWAAAEVRGALRNRGALHLAQAQPALPAAPGGRIAALHLPPGALPEDASQEILREGAQGRGGRHGEAQMVGGAQPRRQPPRVRQPRPADAAAVDEHHASRRPTASSRCATRTSIASTARAASCLTSTASSSRSPTRS